MQKWEQRALGFFNGIMKQLDQVWKKVGGEPSVDLMLSHRRSPKAFDSEVKRSSHRSDLPGFDAAPEFQQSCLAQFA